MSLSASTCNASKVVETVDAVDSTLPDIPNLRAILLPKSESALYSTRLQENKSVLFPVKENICLPSPDASSSEDEDSPTLNKDTSKTQTHTRRRNHNQVVILLEQSENTEKFSLGGSLDNEVVLKHPRSASEESCYINLFHAQLYPDPDCDSLILFNRSTSIFYIQSLTVPQIKTNITPGEEATLECGCWQVTFGNGLDFEITILPWAAREVHYDWVLISPLVTSSPPAKRSRRPVRNQDHEPPNPRDGISDIMTPADPALPASPTRESHTTDELIGKTKQTLVFKGTRNGTTVAIKVCRKPGVKESADAWKNEFKILKRLNHVSKIIEHTSLLSLHFNRHLSSNLWITTPETYASS
jgi:hypothetical protein